MPPARRAGSHCCSRTAAMRGLEAMYRWADNAKLADENEHYRLSVESVLFDESAGTGVISLHLENKQQDGVKRLHSRTCSTATGTSRI